MEFVRSSGYLGRMSRADLAARGLAHTSDLDAHYAAAIVPMTDHERVIVGRLRTRLEALLRSRWPHAMDVEYACVKTKGIEGEFPHTHGACIFLPERLFSQPFDRLFKTFVHEFVHVYQRARPLETHALLNAWGFKPVGLREQWARDHDIRLNPDTNGLIYADAAGRVELMVYNSDTPQSLMDTHNVVIESDGRVQRVAADSRREHPFEFMAYTLADVLVDGVSDPAFEVFARDAAKA